MLNGKNGLAVRSLATILAVVSVILPGTTANLLQGLPLTPYLVVAVPLFIILIWTTKWWQANKLKNLLIGSLIILFLLQIVTSFLPPYGWTLCLKRNVSVEDLTTRCEPGPSSRHGDWTYRYPKLFFGKNSLPTYFINNSGSFNFYRADQPSRYSLPYSLSAQTWVNSSAAQDMVIHTNITSASVMVNDQEIESKKDGDKLTLTIPAGKSHIVLSYATLHDPAQYLMVTGITSPNATQYLNRFWAIVLAQLIQITCLVVTGAVLLLALIGSFVALSRNERLAVFLLVLGLIGSYVLKIQPFRTFPTSWGTILFSIILTLALGWFGIQKSLRRKKLMPFALCLVFLLVIHIVTISVGPQAVVIFSGGNDELGHETFARAVLLAPSWHSFLQAAEASFFYYQPLARFLLAGLHQVFGEAMWGVYVAQLSLFIAVSYTLFQLIVTHVSKLAGQVFWVGMMFWASGLRDSLLGLMQTPYQQALALPLLVMSIFSIYYAMVSEKMSRTGLFGIGLCYGIALMTRSDLAPSGLVVGLLFMFYMGARRDWETVYRIGLIGCGILVPVLFVLYRNYIIGGGWVLFPTSATVNLLTPFYDVVPYHSLTISAGEAIVSIIKSYHGHVHDLIALLWDNVIHGFIGTPKRQFLWYGSPVVALVALLVGVPKLRLLVIYLLGTILVLLLFSSFFAQHNGVAMLGHFDYLILMLAAVSIGSLVARWQKKG